MKIKAYFLFPKSDDDFLKIGNNPQSYQDLIVEVSVIKQQLKAHQDFELCYDLTNVKSFLDKVEILVGGEYLANCRTQIYHLFGNNTRNVSTTFLRKADCIYVNWSFNCTVAIAKDLIAEAAESKHQEEQDKTVLINISDAYVTSRGNVHVIKDAIHYNELPWMIAVPITNNEIEFSEWHTTLSTPDFSLKDKTRFEVTVHRWEKQKICRREAQATTGIMITSTMKTESTLKFIIRQGFI